MILSLGMEGTIQDSNSGLLSLSKLLLERYWVRDPIHPKEGGPGPCESPITNSCLSQQALQLLDHPICAHLLPSHSLPLWVYTGHRLFLWVTI